MSREDDRAKRRNKDCSIPAQTNSSWAKGIFRNRRKLPCDEHPSHLPDTIYVPEEGPVAPPTIIVLPELIVQNTKQTASCILPAVGNTVTVAPGLFKESIFILSLISLDESRQLVLQQKVNSVTQIILTDISPSWFQNNLGVTVAESNILSNAATAAFVRVNNSAFQAAQLGLVCTYYNNPVTVTCPDGGAGTPVTIAQGTFTSSTSQADADSLALDAANNQLVCNFCNPDIKIECPDPNSYNVDGNTTIAAGTFCFDSAAALDAFVKGVTEVSATCVYYNPILTKSCPSPSTTLPSTIPANTVSFTNAQDLQDFIADFYATPLDCQYPNKVVTCSCNSDYSAFSQTAVYQVPNGTFVGVSSDEANTLAQELCESSLACLYCNDEQTDDICPKGLTLQTAGHADKCQFSSTESKDDANNQAKAYAEATKICVEPNSGGGDGGGGGGGSDCKIVNTCPDTVGDQGFANWFAGQGSEGKCQLAGLLSNVEGAGEICDGPDEVYQRYDFRIISCDGHIFSSTAAQTDLRALGFPYSYRLFIRHPKAIYNVKTPVGESIVKEVVDWEDTEDQCAEPSDKQQITFKGFNESDDIKFDIDDDSIEFDTKGQTDDVEIVTGITYTPGPGGIVYNLTSTKTTLRFKNGLYKSNSADDDLLA